MISTDYSNIAVTGIGAISPIGIGFENFTNAAMKSNNGIKKLTLFDTTGYSNDTAGEVPDLCNIENIKKHKLQRMDRSTQFICAAALLAVEDAGLVINEKNKHRVGVIIGTTFGCLKSTSDFDTMSLTQKLPLWVSPSDVPKTTINAAASNVSIVLGAMGHNTTFCCGNTTMFVAIEHAIELIDSGKLDAVVVGCVDDLSKQSYLHHKAIVEQATGKPWQNGSTPFDKRSTGYTLAEGAVVFIIEKCPVANKSVYVAIDCVSQAFFGDTNKSYFCVPKETEYAHLINKAVHAAGLSLKDIDAVSCSANGWHAFDIVEAGALKRVFGDAVPPMVSIKSLIGEAYGAGSAFVILLAISVAKRQEIPASINLVASGLDLKYEVRKREKCLINNVLSISFDPNGDCACIITSTRGLA